MTYNALIETLNPTHSLTKIWSLQFGDYYNQKVP